MPIPRPILYAALLALSAVAAFADDKPTALTPKQILARLQKSSAPASSDAKFAADVVATFGKKNLADGKANAKVEDTVVAWAVESKEPATVKKADGTDIGAMHPLAGTDVQVLAMEFPVGTCFKYAISAGGKAVGAAGQVELFVYGPDSVYHDGVPKGTITKHEWNASKVFPGTSRDWWIYVPAQYKAETPACVMVFQDGGGYQSPTGGYRAPPAMDNLIHKGEMPVTIGIFINPGVFADQKSKDGKPKSNRSVEYDSLGDKYARFLLDEILPEVAKKYNLRKDPGSRAICGASSGGICAWTVAWEHPEEFGRVISHVGSFTNIRGGHVYPELVMKADKKPIKVWLQDGNNDIVNQFGSWPKANQAMAAALKEKGYDYKFSLGDGFHSGKHGGTELPEELRWLWKDYKP